MRRELLQCLIKMDIEIELKKLEKIVPDLRNKEVMDIVSLVLIFSSSTNCLISGGSSLPDCCLHWVSPEPACRKSENSWGEVLEEGEHCQHGDWAAQLQGGDHCLHTQNRQEVKTLFLI